MFMLIILSISIVYETMKSGAKKKGKKEEACFHSLLQVTKWGSGLILSLV